MANNELLRKLLIDEEGKQNEAYQDHLGYWTVAIGHRLDQDQTEEELNAMGLTAPLHDWDGFEVTDNQVYDLFDIDVQDAIDDIAAVFSADELDELGETRRAIVLSMVFQLGGAGFRKFKNFISDIKRGDFTDAADSMMDSLAARQTPERWERASNAMRVGYFQKYNPPVQGTDKPDYAGDNGSVDLTGISDAELITELYNRLVKGA